MILFIDDERRYVKNYIEELEDSGYEVEYIRNVDDALTFVQSEKSKKIEAVVLDVMMPPGKFFTAEQTEDGLNTGIVFLNNMKEFLPNITVFILTNVSREEVRDFFEEQKNCFFCRKDEILPTDFSIMIQDILRKK